MDLEFQAVAEWNQERRTWATQDNAGAFGSPLKIPAAGFRNKNDGLVSQTGTNGYYWTTSINGDGATGGTPRVLVIDSGNAVITNRPKSNGYSLRCIKN